MLEVFYIKATKQVTAWRSEGRQGKRPVREGEARIMLDIKAPSNTARDYVYKSLTKTLELRPDYVPLPEPRDLPAEIGELKVRLDKITKVKGVA